MQAAHCNYSLKTTSPHNTSITAKKLNNLFYSVPAGIGKCCIDRKNTFQLNIQDTS